MDAAKPPGTVYRFDCFVLDLARGALFTAGGVELLLRPKSFALLRFLVENAGRLLGRDAIMSTVWPGLIVSDDSITQCIHDIRRAFGDEAKGLLRTVQRRGYLLVAAVSRVDEDQPDEVRRGSGLNDINQPPPGPDQTEPITLLPSVAAERRHLTVLACDLPGLEELPEQVDPEDHTKVVGAYRERWAAAVTACGGHIESCTREGMLAFFGYPQAHENAAERSVCAGLAIVQAAGGPHSGPGAALRARAGIATGLVVNEPAGPELPGQITVGQPLNLATRLLAAAEPGTLVIADSTRLLVGGLFAFEDLGIQPLTGFTAPIRAWRVTGNGVAESRFQALRGMSLSPLIGRGQELSLLLDRWEQAKEGEGQVVLLSGEPGIGKSRLVQAVRDRLAGTLHFYLGCYCSPDRLDSPLRPMIAHLERAAKFAGDDDSGQKLTKLEVLLAKGGEENPRLGPLIASLLSIPNDGRYPPLDLSPQFLREQTLAALLDQLAGLAARRPVLLVCEDIHWADPTSMELLRLAIDRSQSLRVLLLVTFRSEFVQHWPGHTHVTGLTLNRLSRRRCGQLVAELTGRKSLPSVIQDQIAARAEGVPLFVEELTKEVLESGILREEDGHYALEGPLASPTVPATLQDSLMARLDRLTSARELAQTAAVIGRQFSHELLAAVIPGKEELTEAVRQLIEAELVFRRGVAPYVTYIFKHTLVRDAAYACLLTGKRRQLHARIALALEKHFVQVVETDPDILAHHWTEAGVAENAAAYRLKAGERALAQSAMIEAIAQLTAGRDLLQSVTDGEGRRRVELDLQVALGTAMAAAKGMAAEETARAYERARELCAQLGDEQHLIPVLLGLWSSHNAREEMGAARVVAARLLQLGEQKGTAVANILGLRALGTTLFELGEFTAARVHLERLLEIRSPAGQLLSVQLPYDPCVSGRAWLSLTLSALGYPEQALAQADKALADAEQLQHHTTLALVLTLRCSLGQYLRDQREVGRHAKALLTLAVERKFAYWAGLATYFQGWVQAGAGDIPAGIGEMRRGLAMCQATGAHAYVPYNLALLADMCRQANDIPLSRTLLDTAMHQLGQTDARYSEAVVHCIDGEVRLAMSPPDRSGAEASFRRAIEIAHLQNAKATELHAALCLARLWVDSGERRRAYDLLAPIYGWFTEGFNTYPLNEAKILIDTLPRTKNYKN
jgi:predicted ATPase/class 3 adenylate cyclase/DNA-binding winged helix-turn-helix (wHTH) protein